MATRDYQALVQFDLALCNQHGATHLCGVDEVGRGPLAGPVVAAAVVMDLSRPIDGVYDSKKKTEKQREQLYDLIMQQALAVGFGWVDEQEIDKINIKNATKLAMREAVAALAVVPHLVAIDAETLEGLTLKQTAIIKGDMQSYSIAAASVVAKVTRDRFMKEAAKQYPVYHFESNKGYGAKVHCAALLQHGPCPLHRKTFIKRFL